MDQLTLIYIDVYNMSLSYTYISTCLAFPIYMTVCPLVFISFGSHSSWQLH